MMRAFLLGSASLLAVAVTAPAQAELLFQSIPDLTVAVGSNRGYCSSCGGQYQIFDSFTLANTATIGQIDFVVRTDTNFPTDIKVAITTVSGGLPGAELFTQTFTPAEYAFVNVSHGAGVDIYGLVTVFPAGGGRSRLAPMTSPFTARIFSRCPDMTIPAASSIRRGGASGPTNRRPSRCAPKRCRSPRRSRCSAPACWASASPGASAADLARPSAIVTAGGVLDRDALRRNRRRR